MSLSRPEISNCRQHDVGTQPSSLHPRHQQQIPIRSHSKTPFSAGGCSPLQHSTCRVPINLDSTFVIAPPCSHYQLINIHPSTSSLPLHKPTRSTKHNNLLITNALTSIPFLTYSRFSTPSSSSSKWSSSAGWWQDTMPTMANDLVCLVSRLNNTVLRNCIFWGH